MEFKIKKDDFLNSFKKNNRIITKNPIFPILENIIIKVNQNTLQLTSSNLEIEINTYIDKKYFLFYKEGCITISGKKILNICRNISKNKELHFQLINKKMHIKISSSLFTLNVISHINFPIFQNITHLRKFFIPQKILKNMIELTHFSIARNDIRASLNGILLEYKDNCLYGVTTDGHRLSMYKISLNLNTSIFSIIINRKSILELSRILFSDLDLIQVKISNHNISFKINEILLITKLINSDFPNYSDIVLKKYQYCISISKNKLKESLLKTSILCNTTFKGVCLNFSKNLLKITSSNQENEKSYDSFSIYYIYENISFSINVFYLLDVINAINNNKIIISFNNPISSIQIQSNLQTEITYIIMPLKL
ncbi:Beta sliding clamp [Buchnera aphidicola (Cinara piceae)]|uniref:Beta sliding clamp n=1 Tax=Buchnera aphidicola (Cinara piceae) TaxID=1660043 RepID=A0A803FT82_9GAMM|nr:DNA polymerase III subunit beta [Buchnera aphidicola]VFP87747.1 Beta sliding clamp [Buchnera aphidicola (Cinara piceae)]